MWLKIASALAIGVLAGAAAPEGMSVQITDVGPLAQPAPTPGRPLVFQNTMFEAAPVPNADAAPPTASVRTDPELSPRVLAPQALFQGDGYSRGSSQEASAENRKSGAAGLGLNVPVN